MEGRGKGSGRWGKGSEMRRKGSERTRECCCELPMNLQEQSCGSTCGLWAHGELLHHAKPLYKQAQCVEETEERRGEERR